MSWICFIFIWYRFVRHRFDRSRFRFVRYTYRFLLSKHFVALQDVLRTCLEDAVKTCLEDICKKCLQNVFKTCIEEVFQACLEDILKTCFRDVFKMFWTPKNVCSAVLLADLIFFLKVWYCFAYQENEGWCLHNIILLLITKFYQRNIFLSDEEVGWTRRQNQSGKEVHKWRCERFYSWKRSIYFKTN